MATKLDSAIHRDCDIPSSWFPTHRVIVTIHPSGFIGFREKGKRSQYKLNLVEAARQAVVQSTNKIRARERDLRLAGKRRGARKAATREVLANITA
jgi:hypothetical protein